MPSAGGWPRRPGHTGRCLKTAAISRTVTVLGAPDGGSAAQAGGRVTERGGPDGPARRSGDAGLRAPLALCLGEATGELTEVTGADQPAHGRVT